MIPGDIEIAGGQVTKVGIPATSSKIAVPGFIDLHTHGYSGTDFAAATPDQLREAARAITRTGVTAFQPTLISASLNALGASISRFSETRSDHATILGVHLEGPFISPEQSGAHPVEHLIAPDQAYLDELMGAGPVTQVTIAPELPGSIAAISDLAARGVRVSIGHTNADTQTSRSAFNAGAGCVTHVFNAIRPLHHRRPGPVGVALADQSIFLEAVFDGHHLAGETEQFLISGFHHRLIAVTDANAGADAPDGSYRLGELEIDVRDNRSATAKGTLAGSTLTMDRAFRRLIDLGLDPVQAVQLTSRNPARFIGRPELGTLRPGTRADLVILDQSFEVAGTFIGGTPCDR